MAKDQTDTALPEPPQNPSGDGLARLAPSEDPAALVQAHLESALNDQFLARADPGAALARDFEVMAELSLPASSDIEAALSRFEEPTHQSLKAIEKLLSLDAITDIAMDGIRLNELLDRGGDRGKERIMLARGLQFLGHKKYSDAAEWWTLNRPTDQQAERHLYRLLTLLLALTYKLAGDETASQAAMREAGLQ